MSPWLALAIWLVVVATIIPVMGMAMTHHESRCPFYL